MSNPTSLDITRYLRDLGEGRERDWAPIWQALQGELRKLASGHMRREREGYTLQTTALINEAYLRLSGSPSERWENRSHFLGAASRAMRQVLVDMARKRSAEKRGGAADRLTLTDIELPSPQTGFEVIALDEALQQLADVDERLVRIVELKYFGGLAIREIGQLMNLSARTVNRELRLARAWLRSRLESNH